MAQLGSSICSFESFASHAKFVCRCLCRLALTPQFGLTIIIPTNIPVITVTINTVITIIIVTIVTVVTMLLLLVLVSFLEAFRA